MVNRDAMKRLVVVAILMVLTQACAKRPRVPVRAPVPTPTASAPRSPGAPVRGATARVASDGEASYYGDPYHGRRTANGETFDKNKLTAAHRTLAFDTWVRVENLTNGKTVDVRINDRGPFVDGRIIDLSEAAARRVDMIRSGVVPVRLEVIRQAPGASRARAPADDVFYVIQVGAFRSEEPAQALRQRFARKYTGIYVEKPTPASPLYKVRIGRSLLQEARRLQNRIRDDDDIEAIVIQVGW
jgi:rare lipoprotein A